MNTKSILVLIVIFVGCEKAPDSYTNRSYGPAPYSETHYEYSFGHFAAPTGDLKIDRVVFDADRENWPIIWNGEEPINLRHENASSLKVKFGDKLSKVMRDGPGYDFEKVLGCLCDVFFDEEGRLRRVYAFGMTNHGPRLSLTPDSEVLTLPCTPAELEKCFGKPLRVETDQR